MSQCVTFCWLSAEFFGGGASTLLSVRGEAVLSWADEDSFVVDDKATSGHEVHDLMHFCHFLRSTGSFFEDFSCIVRGSFIVKRTC